MQKRNTMNKQEYIAKVLEKCELGTTMVGEYVNAHTKITLMCPGGHTRQTTTNTILSKGGSTICKECRGKTATGKKTDATVAAEFLAAGLIKLEPYRGALVKILAKNIACNHEYLVSPSSVSRGRNILCPKCSNRRSNYTEADFENELKGFGLVPLQKYAGMKQNLNVLSQVCGHTYEINPGHLLYDKIGAQCPVCNGGTSIKARFFSKLIDYGLTLQTEYIQTQVEVTVKNVACNHVYQVIPNNLVCADSGKICRICTPTSQVSSKEIEVVNFIKNHYNGWIETSDRLILEGKELDIVLPDLGLAIEFNGTYWHREDNLGSQYHLDKTQKVELFGYKLIHIFDWEWELKQDIVKSRLLSALGCTNKIFARRTEVREIPFPRQFLEDNHMQGAGTISKYNYGLFLDNTMVAVMTFGTPRFNSGYTYELIRYCSLNGTTVVGGPSKLLRAFTNVHKGSIISYSDRRWGQGDLYKILGFKHIHNSQPNYAYFKGQHRMSRYQCTKQALKLKYPEIWDSAKSETQIMQEAGWHKVYDSGSGVWALNAT